MLRIPWFLCSDAAAICQLLKFQLSRIVTVQVQLKISVQNFSEKWQTSNPQFLPKRFPNRWKVTFQIALGDDGMIPGPPWRLRAASSSGLPKSSLSISISCRGSWDFPSNMSSVKIVCARCNLRACMYMLFHIVNMFMMYIHPIY